jgi:hypothetical protein
VVVVVVFLLKFWANTLETFGQNETTRTNKFIFLVTHKASYPYEQVYLSHFII